MQTIWAIAIFCPKEVLASTVEFDLSLVFVIFILLFLILQELLSLSSTEELCSTALQVLFMLAVLIYVILQLPLLGWGAERRIAPEGKILRLIGIDQIFIPHGCFFSPYFGDELRYWCTHLPPISQELPLQPSL